MHRPHPLSALQKKQGDSQPPNIGRLRNLPAPLLHPALFFLAFSPPLALYYNKAKFMMQKRPNPSKRWIESHISLIPGPKAPCFSFCVRRYWSKKDKISGVRPSGFSLLNGMAQIYFKAGSTKNKTKPTGVKSLPGKLIGVIQKRSCSPT